MTSIASINARLRRVCDMDAAFLREYSGLHDDYDGYVADLSPAGVTGRLAELGGPTQPDAHDEAQLASTENAMRIRFGEVEEHRWNPWVHLEALDLSVYEREYGPSTAREGARTKQLALWPTAVDNAITALDGVAAPVAAAFLPSVRGLASGIRSSDGDGGSVGLHALGRLTTYLKKAAENGNPNPCLGTAALTNLLSCEDLIRFDVNKVAQFAESEYARMSAIRCDAADKIDRAASVAEISTRLHNDYGKFADILADAQASVSSALNFSREHQLLPVLDSGCIVEQSPDSRSWSPARVSWRGTWDSAGHSTFHISAPDASWNQADQNAWLARFNRAAMLVVAPHEVAPGHCSHALMMAGQSNPIRRTLWSELFFEGWAHYVEEMMWEEGYRAVDGVYQFAFAEEAMIRTIRVLAAIGIHTGALSIPDAVALFEARTPLKGAAARGEAVRGVWEPTYTRYTIGKALIYRLRDAARREWGARFSLPAFHRALMGFGSPPVGLVPRALGLTTCDFSSLGTLVA